MGGGGGTICFTTVEIEKNVPPNGKLQPETTVEYWVAQSGCSQAMMPSADYGQLPRGWRRRYKC